MILISTRGFLTKSRYSNLSPPSSSEVTMLLENQGSLLWVLSFTDKRMTQRKTLGNCGAGQVKFSAAAVTRETRKRKRESQGF